MKTKEITQEQISALADGELVDADIDAALAALRDKEGQSDWELYHQIGDVLRSDDMDVTMSTGFAARMAARLDAEPTIIAPAFAAKPEPASTAHVVEQPAMSRTSAKPSMKRFAIPGAVAAAAASIAFFTAPSLMVALKEKSSASEADVAVVANPAAAPAAQAAVVVSANGAEGVVLRDSRIDDYLLAHQRFSPSVYSSAQYARSASITTDSNK